MDQITSLIITKQYQLDGVLLEEKCGKWTENCRFSSRFGSVQIALLIRILTKLYLRKRVLILTKGAKDIRGNGLSFKGPCLSGAESNNLRLKKTLVCKRKENTF